MGTGTSERVSAPPCSAVAECLIVPTSLENKAAGQGDARTCPPAPEPLALYPAVSTAPVTPIPLLPMPFLSSSPGSSSSSDSSLGSGALQPCCHFLGCWWEGTWGVCGEREPGNGLILLGSSSTSEIDKMGKAKALGSGVGEQGGPILRAERSRDRRLQACLWPCSVAHSSRSVRGCFSPLCPAAPSPPRPAAGEELRRPGGACGQAVDCWLFLSLSVHCLDFAGPGFPSLAKESQAESG